VCIYFVILLWRISSGLGEAMTSVLFALVVKCSAVLISEFDWFDDTELNSDFVWISAACKHYC
jgi:hypothetical protein